jgi:hypothetical protein
VIIALLGNPVAFVVAFAVMLGYGSLAGWTDDDLIPFSVFVVVYLLCAWLLPWWTRPILLWRYWRAKRAQKALVNQFPTWPKKPV